MANTSVTALKVSDESFLVSSLIERCPKTMMIRELIMNAVEAANGAPEGKRLVEVSVIQVGGIPKLAIWNTGRGLNGADLMKICDIASSLHKQKGLHGNFGMGAKVASLPSNRLGMRYRSCTNGRVHEVILCQRDGTYGRLRRQDPATGAYVEVCDVTELAIGEGRKVQSDWTEVVLLGNRSDQDTVKDPFDGDPVQDNQWLATYLYHRFYHLPTGVNVTLLKGTNKLDGNRKFETIPQRLRHFEKNETVVLPNGIKIHYLYDAPYDNAKGSGHNKSISGAIASAVSTCALVYRGEMYDVRRGRGWTYDAPIFGIPFGAKHISVHIELPESFEAVPEAYRRHLQYASGEQRQVCSSDFADYVRDNRPDWLIELIRKLAPDSSSNDEIRKELQDLLDELRLKRVSPKVSPQGRDLVDPGSGGGSDLGGKSNTSTGGTAKGFKPTDLNSVPTGSKRADLYNNMERAPEIIELREESEIEEKGLSGRAARYVMESSQLFVNMRYSTIDDMRRLLEREYAGASDVEMMRRLVLQHSEITIMRRVGRAVIFALAKQLNTSWDQRALETASSPESLSMAADDYMESLTKVRQSLGKAFANSKGQSEPTAKAAA